MKHQYQTQIKLGEVISIDSEAFTKLLEVTVSYIRDRLPIENKWVGSSEAKRMLQVNSNTTLQQLRNSGSIRYSQPMHKVILYDRESINEFLEKNARNTF